MIPCKDVGSKPLRLCRMQRTCPYMELAMDDKCLISLEKS